MATAPDDDDTLELTDQVGEHDDKAGDEAADEITQTDDDDGEETVVTFGDEEPAQAAPAETDLIKHLRTQIRERDKALAEARKAAPVEKPIEVGEKPTLAGCDYDEEAFEAERDAWEDRKAKAKEAETAAEQRQSKQSEEWQAELARYETGKAALGFADAKDVEDLVTSQLDQVQQSVLVMAADDPALVLYSLGKHPAKLAELAKIQNPVKLAAAIAKLEGALKVTKVRKAPKPDEVTRGSAGVVAGSDKQLERLEKEAARTGNRTDLIAYKKKLKAK